MADTLRAPIIAGLAVGIAFVLGFSIFGYAAICGGSGAQYAQQSLDSVVRISDMGVYGTISNVELVAGKENYGDDRGSFTSIRVLVTVFTDEYLFDKTGKRPAFITFSDHGHGCVSVLKSTISGHSCGIEYNLGERSLFFVYDHNGRWSSGGFNFKFDMIEDEKGQKYLHRVADGVDKAPVLQQELEHQVKQSFDNLDPRENSQS